MTQSGTLLTAPAAVIRHHETFVTEIYCNTKAFQDKRTKLSYCTILVGGHHLVNVNCEVCSLPLTNIGANLLAQ